ncbi:response regulator transcription factor [Solimonas marina]|uniref:Response regulator transcription factor n=1 Tax=Solimonas marina TaxID=2714601 RepID=A0A970B3G9_9GAMM|nr:response regulator transcription factor [Solimonas marina]NKF21232.1 response regulator transcription factor [Solimonas marina]
MRVLLIEDNADLAANVGDYLEALGHSVDFAYDGPSGLTAAAADQADVLILDRLLPGFDGATLCRRLRSEYGIAVPVLMLTAMDAVDDRVSGLDSGADDYLVKPFALAELVARMQALHRRASGAVAAGALHVADLEYDPRTMEARRAGQLLQLNRTMRRLLDFLMRQDGRIVSRHELEYLLWGDDVPDGDVLRAHMHALRNVIDKPFPVKLLHTLRGSGFRLAVTDVAHDDDC